jgi:hypothetical protein
MPDIIEVLELVGQTVVHKLYLYDPKTNKFRERVIKRTSTMEALDDFYRLSEVIREQPPIIHENIIQV